MSFKRFKSLLMKSATVQLEIEKEQSRRLPDTLRLLMLKKQRLYILDKLHTLRQHARQRSDARRKKKAQRHLQSSPV